MLVAIEGIDGAGKRTQARLLKDRAEQAGLSAAVVSFPRYGQTVFARSVTDYLNGSKLEMGPASARYTALLYAGDRFESRDWLEELRRNHDLVVLDRYVGSNLAYQGAKVQPAQRQALVEWIATIEYEVFGLPPADLNVLLDVPLEVASALVHRKPPRTYTDRRQDLHEADADYLAQCRDVYHWLTRQEAFGPWVTVNCVDESDQMRSAEAICDSVCQKLGIGKAAKPHTLEIHSPGSRQA